MITRAITERGLGWRYGKGYPDYLIYDRYSNLIASGIKTEETAKGIVDYVNSHAGLVAALEQMRDQFTRHTCKFHGPAVCDKCEALKAANDAISNTRN